MSYLSLTDTDREAMLAAIGVDTVDELFRDIPAGVRFGRELALEPPLTEAELQRHLEELAARNVDSTRELSFPRSPTQFCNVESSSPRTRRTSPR